jgi:flagellar assembly factor FliW
MSNDLQASLDDKVFQFPMGLPGFPDDRRFVLARVPQEAPFAWLTSLDHSELSFIVVEPRHVLQEFTFDVDDEALASIGNPSPLDTALLLIVRIASDGTPRLLANLRAPILLNLRSRVARQVILSDDSAYSDSHPISP